MNVLLLTRVWCIIFQRACVFPSRIESKICTVQCYFWDSFPIQLWELVNGGMYVHLVSHNIPGHLSLRVFVASEMTYD